jgi:arylsulfatase A-like enzyme
MPERFKKMYDPSKLAIPENYMEEHPHYRSIRDIRDEKLAPYPRSPKIVQEHLAEYYGMITHLDDEMGKVMKTVEDRGELDNTIFIMAGDNGLALGQHGLFGKQNHYDHSVRVPLIFAGPGIPKDTKTDSFAYLLDIFPTLCEVLSIPTPESVEGVSLLPAMQKPGEQGRDELYFAYTDYMRSVRKGPHKLIRCWEGEQLLTELYHLENDPFELENLSEQEPSLVQELLKELEKMAEEWDDRQHPMGQTFWSR